MSQVRTRFAPSPTGALHAGTVRTALFAWIIAKQADGKFILRIEDTDKAREVEGAINNITDSLRYLGTDWQEGPEVGGEYGPYIQSERTDIYKQWAQKLVDSGRAYADNYSSEQLDELREQAKQNKQAFLFRNHRPENPPKWDGSQPLRLKSDPKNYTWTDEVMGELSTGPEVVDDIIIMKADGFPTYNFAHIIDDYLMKITHVVRSQEFLSSMPKFLNLYEALGFDRPTFITLPPVLDESGKKKLSKRAGAKQILDYQAEGYLPEAMINFLATLGWNDGTEQEIFSVDEIVKKFDVSRIQKGGAILDEQRLNWISGNHIRSKSLDELYELVSEKFWPKSSVDYDADYKKQVLALVQERMKFFGELSELTIFFFEEPKVKQEQLLATKLNVEDCKKFLNSTIEKLNSNNFEIDNLENDLRQLCEALDTKPGQLFKLIRVSITGSEVAPGLFETMNVMGKESTITRLSNALKTL